MNGEEASTNAVAVRNGADFEIVNAEITATCAEVTLGICLSMLSTRAVDEVEAITNSSILCQDGHSA